MYELPFLSYSVRVQQIFTLVLQEPNSAANDNNLDSSPEKIRRNKTSKHPDHIFA